VADQLQQRTSVQLPRPLLRVARNGLSDVGQRAQHELPADPAHPTVEEQQRRKTAGLLENYYAKLNDETLVPSFQRCLADRPFGHFAYAFRQRPHTGPRPLWRSRSAYDTSGGVQDEAVFHYEPPAQPDRVQEDKAKYARSSQKLWRT